MPNIMNRRMPAFHKCIQDRNTGFTDKSNPYNASAIQLPYADGI